MEIFCVYFGDVGYITVYMSKCMGLYTLNGEFTICKLYINNPDFEKCIPQSPKQALK